MNVADYDALVLPGGQINPDKLRLEPKACLSRSLERCENGPATCERVLLSHVGGVSSAHETLPNSLGLNALCESIQPAGVLTGCESQGFRPTLPLSQRANRFAPVNSGPNGKSWGAGLPFLGRCNTAVTIHEAE